MMTAILAVGFVFKLARLPSDNEWFEPLRRIRINTTAVALLTLFVTLVIEVYLGLQRGIEFTPAAFEVIGIGWELLQLQPH